MQMLLGFALLPGTGWDSALAQTSCVPATRAHWAYHGVGLVVQAEPGQEAPSPPQQDVQE